MPEGHKTHFIAREQGRRFAGERLAVSSPQGRFRDGAEQLDGQILDAVTARGKRLFYQFEGDSVLHVHLGRYGRFRDLASPPPEPRGQVRLRMVSKAHAADLVGPTTCALISIDTMKRIVSELGPDPLAGGKPGDAHRAVSRSRSPIGALLLDQRVIAGVGNILRAEALFESGVDPEVPGRELSRERFDAIWRSLSRMMRTGARLGRIVAVTAAEAGTTLAKVESAARLRVYGKHDCPRCGGPITADRVASRKLYRCRACQTAR